RYDRLVALLEELTWAENKRLVGSTVEVLVAVGEGRKDGVTGRLSGRARDGRLVHFAPHEGPHESAPLRSTLPRGPRVHAGARGPGVDAGDRIIRPGEVVGASVTYAAPHPLNADGPLVAHRRTRAGDAWEAGRVTRTPGVLLGMPTVGAPTPVAAS